MTLQGCRDLCVPGPELWSASILLCGLCLRLEGRLSIGTIVWESRAPGQDPSPAGGAPRFPPRDHHWTVCCVRAGPEAGGELLPLLGDGDPGSLAAGGLLGDGSRIGWHQGFINCPLCHLGDRALFLRVQRGSSSPRSSKSLAQKALPSASHATDRDEICFYKYK